ncbi:AzlC family ABC transporter permease [Haloarchaeobius sp. DFWS5]|uniref:AzlC family ABC transporter permease n=1 Tax=Haloarchaeobius sp. DFWS5 TaxID=3446114 RepID=UPI003EBC1C34
MSARADVLAGVRATAPILLGIVPFGLIAGVSAVEAGLDPLHAVGMSVFIFAGASQLAAIGLLGDNAPLAFVVLTVVVINLRVTMYSASIAPYFQRFTARWKWLCAYVLTDQAYAISLTEFQETTPEERSRKWYFLGSGFTLWAVWQVSTILGVVVGASVPAGLSLEFAVPLTFMALLFPALKDRGTWTAGVVAGAVAIPAAALPFDLGLVTAAVVGIVAGLAFEIVVTDTSTDAAESPDGTHGDGGGHQ